MNNTPLSKLEMAVTNIQTESGTPEYSINLLTEYMLAYIGAYPRTPILLETFQRNATSIFEHPKLSDHSGSLLKQNAIKKWIQSCFDKGISSRLPILNVILELERSTPDQDNRMTDDEVALIRAAASGTIEEFREALSKIPNPKPIFYSRFLSIEQKQACATHFRDRGINELDLFQAFKYDGYQIPDSFFNSTVSTASGTANVATSISVSASANITHEQTVLRSVSEASTATNDRSEPLSGDMPFNSNTVTVQEVSKALTTHTDQAVANALMDTDRSLLMRSSQDSDIVLLIALIATCKEKGYQLSEAAITQKINQQIPPSSPQTLSGRFLAMFSRSEPSIKEIWLQKRDTLATRYLEQALKNQAPAGGVLTSSIEQLQFICSLSNVNTRPEVHKFIQDMVLAILRYNPKLSDLAALSTAKQNALKQIMTFTVANGEMASGLSAAQRKLILCTGQSDKATPEFLDALRDISHPQDIFFRDQLSPEQREYCVLHFQRQQTIGFFDAIRWFSSVFTGVTTWRANQNILSVAKSLSGSDAVDQIFSKTQNSDRQLKNLLQCAILQPGSFPSIENNLFFIAQQCALRGRHPQSLEIVLFGNFPPATELSVRAKLAVFFGIQFDKKPMDENYRNSIILRMYAEEQTKYDRLVAQTEPPATEEAKQAQLKNLTDIHQAYPRLLSKIEAPVVRKSQEAPILSTALTSAHHNPGMLAGSVVRVQQESKFSRTFSQDS